MMGEVVGRAASVCVEQNCTPREVYKSHWSEMETLLKLPGKARRKSIRYKKAAPGDTAQDDVTKSVQVR